MDIKDEIKVPAFLRKKKRKKAVSNFKNKKKGKIKKPNKAPKPKAEKKKTLKKPAKEKSTHKKVKKTAKPIITKKAKEKPAKAAGEITHYFDKINVAIILVKLPFKVNQTLTFEGRNNFSQKIDSMQFNHNPIKAAKKGQEIGIKVRKELSQGDVVYLKHEE